MVLLKPCPCRETLSDYVLGKLEDTDSYWVDEHLRDCERCRCLLEDVQDPPDPLVEGLRLPRSEEPFGKERGCELAIARCRGLAAAVVSPPTGSVLGAIRDYRLIRELGRGGMGTVYEAVHPHLDLRVALKILPPERMQSHEAVSRFRREMRAVARLDHPNIVRAHDAGEEDGRYFFVMELVDGLDLSALTRRVGPLPTVDACEIIRQAALGLDHAHRRGMVHRDIKPSNLMITVAEGCKGLVKVLDLGLARLDRENWFTSNPPGLTDTHQPMGTIEYMAPEQDGDARAVDVRADIYALGATLFKLLSGDVPFSRDQYPTRSRLMLAKTTEPPPILSTTRTDVPRGLASVIARMLAARPEERFSTPVEVADALAPFAEGSDLPALLAKSRQCGDAFGTDSATIGTAPHVRSAWIDTPHSAIQKPATVPPTRTVPPPRQRRLPQQPEQAEPPRMDPQAIPPPRRKRRRRPPRHQSAVIAAMAVVLFGILLVILIVLIRMD